jgi:hypothetical protein
VLFEQLAHQFTAAVFASPLQQQIENLAFVVDRSQSQNRLPAIRTAISSRRQREVGR